MKIALAQTDPIVGQFDGNLKKISEAYVLAAKAGARLVLTPELSISGYPPHDLLERPEIFERNEKALEILKTLTAAHKGVALAVGHVARNPATIGRRALNQVSILQDGKTIFEQAKSLLPTYDVFDETRYFEPAHERKLWDCDGVRVAVGVCEDLWAGDKRGGSHLYSKDPVDDYLEAGAQLVISLAASPYEWGKREHREKLLEGVAKRLKTPLVYVNQSGGTDEILFDGASFAVNAQGELLGRLPIFRSGFGMVEVSPELNQSNGSAKSKDSTWLEGKSENPAPAEIESLSRGLVTGIHDYFHRTGFQKAIIGLSGGIDSAVVAVLAVQALGARNVMGIAMPSQFSSSHSLADAEALAERLGIDFEVRPIKFSYAAISRDLAENRGGILAPIALENLQARLRGLTLMTLANHYHALVLTTGNKSEIAMGYCTLYGDMVGALAPIGDLFKTRVYELARYLNSTLNSPIPERTLTKAPSAELRPDQKDEDTLPPYAILDPLLEDYLERTLAYEELEKKHGPKGGENWVAETLRVVEASEYKRLQSALALKASPKAFGIGRRLPVAKTWTYP